MIDESARNTVDDIKVNSAWQLGQRLAVVSSVMDGWVTIQYIDGNNGMKRTADIDVPQFLSNYRLFYSPQGKYDLLRKSMKNTQPISLD